MIYGIAFAAFLAIVCVVCVISDMMHERKMRRERDMRYYLTLIFCQFSRNTPCISYQSENMFMNELWRASDGKHDLILFPIGKYGFRLKIHIDGKEKAIFDFPDFNTFLKERICDIEKIAKIRREKKIANIVVEGNKHQWLGDEITYAEVIELFKPSDYFNVVYSVMYARGHEGKPEGILMPGESVMVKDGMVFKISITDQS